MKYAERVRIPSPVPGLHATGWRYTGNTRPLHLTESILYGLISRAHGIRCIMCSHGTCSCYCGYCYQD